MRNLLIASFLTLTFSLAISGTAFSLKYGTYETGNHVRLTGGPRYERNPSYFKAVDGTYWVFFSRSDGNWGNGCDAGGNCDTDSYDVYYMTSTDLVTWTEGGPLLPGSIGQRDVAAFQAADGTIWAFTASGFGGSIDDKIRYYTYDGTTWTGPAILTDAGTNAGHVDAFQASDGTIWVIYEQSGPDTYVISTADEGTSWSTPQIVNSGGIKGGVPKGMEASDGILMVVYTNNGNGIYLAKSADGAAWTQSPNPIAAVGGGLYDYDPVIYEDGDGKLWLFWAPWDSSASSQWIDFVTSSTGKTWSDPEGFTDGEYGNTYWWDMWPELGEGSDLLVFYTSEQSDDGKTRTSGDIWMAKLEDRLEWLEEDDERKWIAITALETQVAGIVADLPGIQDTISSIQTTLQMLKDQIRDIFDYWDLIKDYLEIGYGPPGAGFCGDRKCDANLGETASTCPEDCGDGAGPSEVFITQGWQVTCPETFDAYTIIRCRAEMLKGTQSLANYTLQLEESKKVNWHNGYTLRLYGTS